MSGAVAEAVVLGVGNLLRQDEGVGVHAIRLLRELLGEESLPLVDGGTAVFEALGPWSCIGKLVVIDALRAGKEPGSVTRVTLRELQGRSWPAVSAHDYDLLDALALLRQAGLRVGEIVIYGVEPAEMGWGDELSEPVACSLPGLVSQVMAELGLSVSEEGAQ